MSEAEKQEGQKTVVSFITGLLIGGLLVWVFSSSPEKGVEEENGETTTSTEVSAPTDDDTSSEPKIEVTTLPKTGGATTGSGSLTVGNQAAGASVLVEVTSYPAKEGWIVVRDYKDGVTGNILGASRYNTEVGLLPKSVNLLRKTEAGRQYQVLFYTENGDLDFTTKDDTAVLGGEKVFTAQ